MTEYLEAKRGGRRSIAQQLLRAGTSIGANIEEAQGSQSKADFISKCSIACKEARETHYWLRLLAASNLVPARRLNPITQESSELVAILTAIIRNTKKPRG